MLRSQLSEKGSCGRLTILDLFLPHHSSLQSPIDRTPQAPLNQSEALLNLYKMLLNLFRAFLLTILFFKCKFIAAARSGGGRRRRCSPRPARLLGSHLAPLGEGAELPRLEGGGAGRGAEAQPPRRQRDPGLRRPSSHKQNALGKLSAKKSWEGAFVFSPPRVPTFFSKGHSGSLFSPAASSPTLPSLGRRSRVRLPDG